MTTKVKMVWYVHKPQLHYFHMNDTHVKDDQPHLLIKDDNVDRLYEDDAFGGW